MNPHPPHHMGRSVTAALITASLLALPACSSTPLPRPVVGLHDGTPEPVEVLDDNYIDPDHGPDPAVGATTPPQSSGEDDVIHTLADPAAVGLSEADESAAIRTGMMFLEAVWTWDSTDTSDRAGLQRALPLATAELAERLRPWIGQPLYPPQEWHTLAGRPDVGSTIAVLQAWPDPDGTFNHDTYTLKLLFRAFIAGPNGAMMPTNDEARYATLVLARTPRNTWQVADLPLQDVEQVIEPSTEP